MADTPAHISALRDDVTYAPPGKRYAVRFRRHPLASSVVIVSAFGAIDGLSAHALIEHAFAETLHYRALIVDLSGLEFFGTDGFSALYGISAHCTRTGTIWMLVPGSAVTRLLGICDPLGALPTAETVDAALTSAVAAP